MGVTVQPTPEPTLMLPAPHCVTVCCNCAAGVWLLYRNRQQELLGDCSAAAAAESSCPASPVRCTASTKGPLEVAMEQLDVASNVDDRAAGVMVPAAATNGVGHGKDTRCAGDAV